MRTLTVALFLAAGVATAGPLPELDKAAATLAEGRAPAALKMLDAIAGVGKLDKENLVLLFQLRGMAYAVMPRKEKEAKAAFQNMLWINPDAGLPPSADGKAFKIFKAAKDWQRAAPGLEFRAEPAATDDKGKVMQIAAFLKADPLKLVRKVRFWVKANGGSWGSMLESVQASYAATATEADGVEWWAELLTDKESVLATLGSEDNPILEGKAKKKPAPPRKETRPTPVARADSKADEKKADGNPSDAPVAETSATKKGEPIAEAVAPARPFVVTGVRGLGFGLAAVGAVSAIIGVVCGAASAGTRGELNALPSDGSLINTMTQKEAFDKEASANGLAGAANVLLITGGVLAATGIVLVIAGGPADDAKVSLAPAGAGVVLSGTLP